MAESLSITKGTPRLDLPLDAVTQTFTLLAMRGRGKTYTASVMVEEMVGAGLPVVVIDPTGAWWGLRSSADGKSPGLPVVIFGGKHADVLLEPTAGRLIADLLVENPFPCVIDLTGFDSKAEEIRFMTDFLIRLYRTNSNPLHLMIDEADEFAPQQSFPEGKRLLGAMEQIVRRGRIKGLGCTLITQRPAVLNKNVLSQCETMILLGMTGMNDIKAVDDWVGKHADNDEARSIKASLPSLPVGTAWVWSPSWLGVTKKVQIRRRHTFDSSATPKVGQTRIEPRAMAEVDLILLRKQISATVEKTEAEDPVHLNKVIGEMRQQVRRLEAELAAERGRPVPPPEWVEVPVLSDEDRALIRETRTLMEKVAAEVSAVPMPPSPPTPRPAPQQVRPPVPRPQPVADEQGQNLPKAQRAILTVLARYGTRTKTQVAILAGYTAGGGGFNNALGALRTAGYIERGDPISITEEGIAALGSWEPLPTGQALVEHHSRRLTKAAREALVVLVDAWPEAMTKEEIANATGYAPGGGGFNNALGRLRSLELVITENGLTRAADELAGG